MNELEVLKRKLEILKLDIDALGEYTSNSWPDVASECGVISDTITDAIGHLVG